jgi:hypothetical protein
MSIPHKSLAIAALLTVNLSACVVAPARYPAAYQGVPVSQGETIIYGAAPPPMQMEVVPPLPFAGALWIGGYWGWEGGRHRWMPGHYTRPVPGQRYVPHQWEQQGGRWGLRGGYWAR